MYKIVVFLLLAFCPLVFAQQTMNDDAVIKMVKAGLSDDVVISIVNATSGHYSITPDDLVALKQAGVSDKIIAAIVSKLAAPTPAVPADAPPPVHNPRVYLEASSSGSNPRAARDQSMEMSKDFEKDCAGVGITINEQMADYIIHLNHIESGFVRDNQIQIANRDGDLISKTKEGGSINGNVKKACDLILTDWAKK